MLNNEVVSILSLEVITWTIGMILIVGIVLFPFYLLTGYAISALWAKLAGRSWLSNRRVRSTWPQLEGYRLYLEKVELNRLQYESKDPFNDPITKALPYAIVYSLGTKWQARFKQSKT